MGKIFCKLFPFPCHHVNTNHQFYNFPHIFEKGSPPICTRKNEIDWKREGKEGKSIFPSFYLSVSQWKKCRCRNTLFKRIYQFFKASFAHSLYSLVFYRKIRLFTFLPLSTIIINTPRKFSSFFKWHPSLFITIFITKSTCFASFSCQKLINLDLLGYLRCDTLR